MQGAGIVEEKGVWSEGGEHGCRGWGGHHRELTADLGEGFRKRKPRRAGTHEPWESPGAFLSEATQGPILHGPTCARRVQESGLGGGHCSQGAGFELGHQ